MDVTRKIGVSVPDELYEWASGEVAAGRAPSVSALVAEGLRALEARSEFALLRAEMAEWGPSSDEDRAWVAAAWEAAEEAQRRGRAKRGEAAA